MAEGDIASHYQVLEELGSMYTEAPFWASHLAAVN